MEAFERARLESFFAEIGKHFPTSGTSASFLVTHLLGERPSFVKAVNKQAQLAAVLPKPKSINATALAEVETFAVVDELSRERFSDAQTVVDYLEERAAGQDVVLLDVGGLLRWRAQRGV